MTSHGTRLAVAIVCMGAVLAATPALAQVPARARQFQRALIRNARVVWGLDAPVAVFAAQVHQESSWRPDARSPYANGLAQFTPDTADWISEKYPNELRANQPFNPSWSLRALTRYDKFIYDRALPAATDCDRWAFTLSGYNGGEGWVRRDRQLSTNPSRWWHYVEKRSNRARWALDENRTYVRRILLMLQSRYATWGATVLCAERAP